jgi:hypothetical protein
MTTELRIVCSLLAGDLKPATAIRSTNRPRVLPTVAEEMTPHE